MQEDVENKSVSLSIKAVKLTANLLKKMILNFLTSQKRNRITKQHETPTGKQSVKKLIGQNQGVANIEITDKNIKSFETVARKYGVDFAVKKVAPAPGETVPTYHVFFKSRDADALTSAFKEYTAKKVKNVQRPSVLALLRKLKAAGKENPLADRTKNKSKEQVR